MALTGGLNAPRINWPGIARLFASWLSRDEAICKDLKKSPAHLGWGIRLTIAIPTEMLEFPGQPMLHRLLETVPRTHQRTGRCWLGLTRTHEENRSIDVPFAMAHYARDQSGRL